VISYGRQWIDKRDIQAVIRVLRSDRLTQGPAVLSFEKAFAKTCGAKYAVAVSNGTAALHLACLVAGLGKGLEAITSPLTFLATPNAVLYTGASVVFSDVQKETLNLDPKLCFGKINRRTKAILPVHLAGQPCDLESFYKLKKRRGLVLIEDACHALGSSYQGAPIGNCRYSDMTVFSFHPVKAITTGEGGMVTTNNQVIYQKLLDLRNHGMVRDSKRLSRNEGPWFYEMQTLGFNYRLTDIQAALGSSQLKKLGFFIRQRRAIAQTYFKELKDVAEIETPFRSSESDSSYHLFMVRLRLGRLRDSRRVIFEKLLKAGITPQVHYIPIHYQPYYQRMGFRKGICPIAESQYERILSLPIYPGLKASQIRHVIRSLKKILKESAL
jgi:UDP-4-amino-4,6-dideoxy-N-acetyl-beta-L-altrosamine transaminase